MEVACSMAKWEPIYRYPPDVSVASLASAVGPAPCCPRSSRLVSLGRSDRAKSSRLYSPDAGTRDANNHSRVDVEVVDQFTSRQVSPLDKGTRTNYVSSARTP